MSQFYDSRLSKSLNPLCADCTPPPAASNTLLPKYKSHVLNTLIHLASSTILFPIFARAASIKARYFILSSYPERRMFPFRYLIWLVNFIDSAAGPSARCRSTSIFSCLHANHGPHRVYRRRGHGGEHTRISVAPNASRTPRNANEHGHRFPLDLLYHANKNRMTDCAARPRRICMCNTPMSDWACALRNGVRHVIGLILPSDVRMGVHRAFACTAAPFVFFTIPIPLLLRI